MNEKQLKVEYRKRKKEIKSRLNEFKNQKDQFYELCFCTLTPQSNAFKCDQCISLLKEMHFEKKDFEIKHILKKYTRFHNNKSRYLVRLKRDNPRIFNDLNNLDSAEEKRAYLTKKVTGLGLKEASHFLRNVGHENLAILDRHILKSLKGLKVISEIPKYLTKQVYLEIEEKFRKFAVKIGIPMDELDLLFWSMETGKIFK